MRPEIETQMAHKDKDEGRKTLLSHWDAAYSISIKPKLPSRLNVTVRNVTNLLKRHVTPGCRYLEIGCAPGKTLAWVASELKADAAGLDYSEVGVNQCGSLAKALDLDIELYQEDIFNNSLTPGTFDVVTSFGVIEHFDDPTVIVNRHIDLIKPGGVALVAIPNYGGPYGYIQRWCDAPNLALHNLNIMTREALRVLVEDSAEIESVRAYEFGSVDPWMLNLDKKMPRVFAKSIGLFFNSIGLLMPFTISSIAPMLVLEVRKKQQ